MRVKRRPARGPSGKSTALSVDSHETSPPEAYRRPSRRHVLNRLTPGIRRPGFAMVIAETDGLVGCVFGFPVRSDGFWWLGFDGAPPRGIEQLTASSGTFAQERLPADHQASLGATLVDSLLRVLALPVGDRAAARLEGLADDVWTRWPG